MWATMPSMALRVRDYDRPSKKSDPDDRVSFADRAGRLDLANVPARRKKSQLTPELIEVYGRVLNQATQEIAANAIGFSLRTISSWIAKGQEEDCQDELLIRLADVHAFVMANGNRKATLDVLREHSVDDPKTAVELAKMTIPSVNVPKVQKIDLTATSAKPPSAAEFDSYSDEEIELMAALERARLKRLGG